MLRSLCLFITHIGGRCSASQKIVSIGLIGLAQYRSSTWSLNPIPWLKHFWRKSMAYQQVWWAPVCTWFCELTSPWVAGRTFPSTVRSADEDGLSADWITKSADWAVTCSTMLQHTPSICISRFMQGFKLFLKLKLLSYLSKYIYHIIHFVFLVSLFKILWYMLCHPLPFLS